MTTREAFEAWDRKVFALPDRYYTPLYQGDFPSIDVKARWRTWQAATDAALERAAQKVEPSRGTKAIEVIGGEDGLLMLRELAAEIRALKDEGS